MKGAIRLLCMVFIMLYIVALPMVRTLMSAYGIEWGTHEAGLTLSILWIISATLLLLYVCNTVWWNKQ